LVAGPQIAGGLFFESKKGSRSPTRKFGTSYDLILPRDAWFSTDAGEGVAAAQLPLVLSFKNNENYDGGAAARAAGISFGVFLLLCCAAVPLGLAAALALRRRGREGEIPEQIRNLPLYKTLAEADDSFWRSNGAGGADDDLDPDAPDGGGGGGDGAGGRPPPPPPRGGGGVGGDGITIDDEDDEDDHDDARPRVGALEVDSNLSGVMV